MSVERSPGTSHKPDARDDIAPGKETCLYDLTGRRIFVAGHRGMVGSAIVRRLAAENCIVMTASRGEVDLREQRQVREWMAQHRPEVVVVAAAKVGGILANDSYPADFLYENLMIEANLIEAAWRCGAQKLLFLGSSCIYPRLADQPITEDALLTGALEPTNEWYAVAKIAGIKLCQAYRRQHGFDCISAMPTNLYGPGDNYDLATSHVLPALIRKVDQAKRTGSPVEIWGTGTPLREFLHADDCADACVFLLRQYSAESHVNVGYGSDVAIRDLVQLVMEVAGYSGEIVHDLGKPDGTPRKLMDSSLLRGMGWQPRISLKDGIADAYRHYLAAADRV
jgi:GDP-L-fucose synthase